MKNFRDFGYENVKRGLLYRGEALTDISIKEGNLLKDNYNIKVVIDLRMDEEVNEKKDIEIAGIKNIHIPLVKAQDMAMAYEKASKENRKPVMEDFYCVFVSRNTKESWTKIFDILLEEEGVLFHCTQGKDRTGVVSAMILTALGVRKDVIMNDYLLTNENLSVPFKYKLRALFMKKEAREDLYSHFRLKKEYLDKASSYIDEEYGSVDKFFTEICGLDEDKLNKLKKKYLEM